MRIHFLLKSDVLTFVAVVVPWTWSIGAWREKSTFGHRNWLFRSRYLNSPVFLSGEGNMSRGIWAGEYDEGNLSKENIYYIFWLLLLAIVLTLHSPVTVKAATSFSDSDL